MKSSAALSSLLSRSENLEKHPFGFLRGIGAELVAKQFPALSKHPQRLGAVAHMRVHLHQVTIPGLLKRLELDDFTGVLDGKRVPRVVAVSAKGGAARDQKRPESCPPRFDPVGFFAGQNRTTGYDDTQRRGSAGARR